MSQRQVWGKYFGSIAVEQSQRAGPESTPAKVKTMSRPASDVDTLPTALNEIVSVQPPSPLANPPVTVCDTYLPEMLAAAGIPVPGALLAGQSAVCV